VLLTTDAVYSVKIVGDLWWNFTFYANWNNRAPATFSSTDYGSSSGITYSFH